VTVFCDAADGRVFRWRFMPSKAGEHAFALTCAPPQASSIFHSGLSLKRRRPEDEFHYEKLHLFCRGSLRGHRLLLDLEFSRWRKCPSSGNRKVGFKPPRAFSPELCQDI